MGRDTRQTQQSGQKSGKGNHRRPRRGVAGLTAGALAVGLGVTTGLMAGPASADPAERPGDLDSYISSFQRELDKARGQGRDAIDQFLGGDSDSARAAREALTGWLDALGTTGGTNFADLFTTVAPTATTDGETLVKLGAVLGDRAGDIYLLSVPGTPATQGLGVNNVGTRADTPAPDMGKLFEQLGKHLKIEDVTAALTDPDKFSKLLSDALSKVVNDTESGFEAEDLTDLLAGLINKTPENTDPNQPLDEETIKKVLSGIGPVVQKVMDLGQKIIAGDDVTAADFQDLISSITDLLTNAGIDLGDQNPADGDGDQPSKEEQAKQDYEDLLNSTVTVTDKNGKSSKMTVKDLLDKLGVKYEQPGTDGGQGGQGGTGNSNTGPGNDSGNEKPDEQEKVTPFGVKLSAGRVAPGAEFGITGEGFTSGEKVTVALDNIDTKDAGATVTVTADDSGKIDATLTAPNDTEVTSHKVGVTGETSKRTGVLTVTVDPALKGKDQGGQGDGKDTDDDQKKPTNDQASVTDPGQGSSQDGAGDDTDKDTTGGNEQAVNRTDGDGTRPDGGRTQQVADATGGGSNGDGTVTGTRSDNTNPAGNSQVPGDGVVSNNAAAEGSLPETGASHTPAIVVGLAVLLLLAAGGGAMVMSRRSTVAE